MTQVELILLWMIPAPVAAATVATIAAGRRLPASLKDAPAFVGVLSSLAATVAAGVLLYSNGVEVVDAAYSIDWINLPGLKVPVSIRVDATSVFLLTGMLVGAVVVLVSRRTGLGVQNSVFGATLSNDTEASGGKMNSGRPTPAHDWKLEPRSHVTCSDRDTLRLCLSVVLTTMVITAADFLTLAVFWMAIPLAMLLTGEPTAESTDGDVETGRLRRKRRFPIPPGRSAAADVVINRAADVLLLTGVFLMLTRFGSTNFDELLAPGSPNVAVVLDDNPALIAVACLCLYAAAAVRCGQFPWLATTENLSRRRSTTAAVATIVLVPGCASVMARISPLLDAAPAARTVMTAASAVTVLLSACVSVVQTERTRSTAWALASLTGMMFLGFSTGETSGRGGAILCSVIVATAGAALLTSPRVERLMQHSGATSSAPRGLKYALILACGVWGPCQIVGTLWSAEPHQPDAHARTVASQPPPLLALRAGVTPDLLPLVVFALSVVGLFAASVALIRSCYLPDASTETLQTAEPAIVQRRGVSVMIVGFAVSSLAVWAATGGLTDSPAVQLVGRSLGLNEIISRHDPLTLGVGLFPTLLGTVVAWMRFSGSPAVRVPKTPVASPESLRRRDDVTIADLCRERFRIDDVLAAAFVRPVWRLCGLPALIDLVFLKAIPARVARTAGRRLREFGLSLNVKSAQFQSTAILLAAAVLLAMLLWLGA